MLRRLALLPWLVLLLAASPAAASPTALYSFGDSLSDRGNIFILTSPPGIPGIPQQPVPPYSDGRFSNGPIWLDGLAAALGLGPVVPNLGGGTDFAYGGATAAGQLPVDLQNQVAALVFGGPAAPSGALFTLWAGANDIFNALSAPSTLPGVVAAAAQSVAGAAATLVQQAGARELLVLNVPDLGLTPRLNGNPAVAALATSASNSFNALLLSALAANQAALAPAELHVLDVFSLLRSAVADPAAFGFTNTSDACVPGSPSDPGTPCAPTLAGQNQYVFWDGIHPTSAAHQVIASRALALIAVPEPSMLVLLVSALVGLWVARRRG